MKKGNPDIFKLNNSSYSWKPIGDADNRLVIIEDLFAYPDLVREYAMSCTYFPLENTIHPGVVHRMSIELNNILNLVCEIKNECFNDINGLLTSRSYQTTFQAYRSNNENTPHYDFAQYAALCSLNTADENPGISGTSFYRHRNGHEYATTSGYRSHIVKRGRAEPNDWTQYHLEMHSYNKFIMYEGYMYHNLWFKENEWRSENPRLTFNMFLQETL